MWGYVAGMPPPPSWLQLPKRKWLVGLRLYTYMFRNSEQKISEGEPNRQKPSQSSQNNAKTNLALFYWLWTVICRLGRTWEPSQSLLEKPVKKHVMSMSWFLRPLLDHRLPTQKVQKTFSRREWVDVLNDPRHSWYSCLELRFTNFEHVLAIVVTL